MTRVYLALEGEEPAPLALQVARICKEFPCYGPAEAEAALRRAPVGWLDEVIEARHFAEAKAIYDRTKPEEIPELIKQDELLDLVDEIWSDVEHERLATEPKDDATP